MGAKKISRGRFLNYGKDLGILYATSWFLKACAQSEEESTSEPEPEPEPTQQEALLNELVKGYILFESARNSTGKDSSGYDFRQLHKMGLEYTKENGVISVKTAIDKLTDGNYSSLNFNGASLEGTFHSINPVVAGDEILFNITNGINSFTWYLAAMGKDGSNVRIMGENMFYPFASSDGTKLGYHTIKGGRYKLAIASLSNGELSEATIIEPSLNHEYNGSFSPDGQWIVSNSYSPIDSSTSLNTLISRILMGKPKGARRNGIGGFREFPGTYRMSGINYSSSDSSSDTDSTQEENLCRIIKRSADGTGDPVVLAEDAAVNSRPVFSPDGKRVLYHNKDYIVYDMDTEGGNKRMLTRDPNNPDKRHIADHEFPIFTPEGNIICSGYGFRTAENPTNAELIGINLGAYTDVNGKSQIKIFRVRLTDNPAIDLNALYFAKPVN